VKSRTSMCITAITLFAALAISVQLSAQPTIVTFDAPGAGTGSASPIRSQLGRSDHGILR